jgi:hypothetical protein
LVSEGRLGYASILFMILIIWKDSNKHSVDGSSSSDSSEQSADSSSDSDSEASDLDAPEALLHFPDPDDDEEENDLVESETYCDLPSTVQELQDDLRQGYCLPAVCPGTVAEPRKLTPSEELSLKHYVAWKKSNGTVLAYKLHAALLFQATGIDVLALYSVQKLAMALAELKPSQVKMCPRSCMAYIDKFADMESCTHSRDGKMCGESRYKPKARPTAKDKP